MSPATPDTTGSAPAAPIDPARLLIRPVAQDDLETLVALSGQASFGLTSLPPDERLLGRRIRKSLESFARLDDEPEPGDEYLLVIEDGPSGRVVGTSGIYSKVGGFAPFYAYRIENSLHESKSLGVRKEVQALHLVIEHDGPTEIGTLFLSPTARRGGVGRMLSLSRFLLMAEFPDAFDERVIAEMRGVIDEEGRSPFWEALGRHFFDVDLPTADHCSVEDKTFIADLMPRHPIYLPLLPEAAQAVVGRVHPLTEPALHLLESEGFRRCDSVDIFDAGPMVECPRGEIRTVRDSRRVRLAGIEADPLEGPPHLIARRAPFRVARGPVRFGVKGATVSRSVADLLDLEIGDEARVVALQSRKRPGASRG